MSTAIRDQTMNTRTTLAGTPIVAALSGIPQKNILSMATRGQLAPAATVGGRHYWTQAQAVGLCLFRTLRKNDVSPTTARKVYEAVAAITPEKLREATLAGRTHLLVTSQGVCPRLLSPKSIAEQPRHLIDACQAVCGPVLAIDLALATRQIGHRIRELIRDADHVENHTDVEWAKETGAE